MQSLYSKSIKTKIQQGHQTPEFGHYLTIRMEQPYNPGDGSGRCAACVVERRSVTSRYHGSKISGSQQKELKQRRRRRVRTFSAMSLRSAAEKTFKF